MAETIATLKALVMIARGPLTSPSQWAQGFLVAATYETARALSLISTSPFGPKAMNRGFSNPSAYSSAVKPFGKLNCAPSGRGMTFGALVAEGVW